MAISPVSSGFETFSRLELSDLVFQEIEATLSLLDRNSALRQMALEPILAQADAAEPQLLRRSFLALLIYQLLGGQPSRAAPAGAAVEFFAAALDVFDDLEDQDTDDALWRKYGTAQALNAATALLMLAQMALSRLRRQGFDVRTTARVAQKLSLAGTIACIGQHFDLQWEDRPTLRESEYLKMTRLKSASLVECACLMGAILAGTDRHKVAAFGRFGRSLGMAAQIDNDVTAIGRLLAPKGATNNSDITRRKKTLPVVYALAHAPPEDRQWLIGLYASKSMIDSEAEARVVQMLRRSGAIYYSLTVAELYKDRAMNALEKSGVSPAICQAIKQALGLPD